MSIDSIIYLHHCAQWEIRQTVSCFPSKKFQAPKQVACDLVVEERFGLPMSVLHIETVRIMKYCKNKEIRNI